MGAHRERDAGCCGSRGAGAHECGRRDRRAGPQGRCDTGEAALVALARHPRMKKSAAWIFVTPALLVVMVFFVFPVAAGLALSVTDFDIYALADPSSLRFVGLDNYISLLQTALFWH